MNRVELQKYIVRVTKIFYRIGIWDRQDNATVAGLLLLIFYSYSLIPIIVLMAAGAFGINDMAESIFLMEFSLICVVLQVKLLNIVWKKEETLELLNRFCLYSVRDDDTFTHVKTKLNRLMIFFAVFCALIVVSAVCSTIIIPLVSSERTFFFKIGFPLDWKNDEIAYWLAFTLIVISMTISSIGLYYSAIIWYMMANCGLKFHVLGQRMKTMGKQRLGIGRKEWVTERDKLYLRDLLKSIAAHNQLTE